MTRRKKPVTLPKRVFQSPLILYANFADGRHINLIRITPPYKNGYKYAIHDSRRGPTNRDRMFKTLELAAASFKVAVRLGCYHTKLIRIEKTTNY